MKRLMIITNEFHKRIDSKILEQIEEEVNKIIHVEKLESRLEKGRFIYETEILDYENANRLQPVLKKIKGVYNVHIEEANEGTGELIG